MKAGICILILSLLAAASARAGSTGYAYCGTYGSYVMLYKSTDQFEELGKLRCGEKVEILARWVEYFQVRTGDGRVGWVRYSEISITPPAGQATNTFGLTDPSARPRTDAVPPLTNANILKMHGMRLSSDIIVAKIQSSPCEFDTSPATLQKLKQAGVSDKVILAMVQAPSASAPPAPKAPEIVEVKIPGGTAIEVELNINFSSDSVQEGMIVPMSVVQDVVVNGVTAFPRGSEAHARVTTIKQPGFMNRPPGELSWTMEYVTAVTGDHIPATFYSKDASANPLSSFMGAAGPSWQFHKGKPAVVAAGQRFQAVVHGDTVLRVPQSLAAGSPAAPTGGQPTVQAAGQPSASAAIPKTEQPAPKP